MDSTEVLQDPRLGDVEYAFAAIEPAEQKIETPEVQALREAQATAAIQRLQNWGNGVVTVLEDHIEHSRRATRKAIGIGVALAGIALIFVFIPEPLLSKVGAAPLFIISGGSAHSADRHMFDKEKAEARLRRQRQLMEQKRSE